MFVKMLFTRDGERRVLSGHRAKLTRDNCDKKIQLFHIFDYIITTARHVHPK